MQCLFQIITVYINGHRRRLYYFRIRGEVQRDWRLFLEADKVVHCKLHKQIAITTRSKRKCSYLGRKHPNHKWTNNVMPLVRRPSEDVIDMHQQLAMAVIIHHTCGSTQQ